MQAFGPFLSLQWASNTHFIEDGADSKTVAVTRTPFLNLFLNFLST